MMGSYTVERIIFELTDRTARANARGISHITLDVDKASEIIAALCNRTANNGEAVAPVPNEGLRLAGWCDVKNCGACGNQLRFMANFCDVCGRPVKN